MELQRVSFELAKKLKEVGFDIASGQYYQDGVELILHKKSKINNNKYDHTFEAPTLELAKMWFRDKHKINIDVYPNAMGWQFNIEKINGTHIQVIEEYNDRNVYENALEQGLLKACELIKK